MEYKIELMKLGKTQRDVVKALADKGITTSTPDLCAALKGLPRPKYEMLRSETEKIIDEWKKG